MDFLPLHYSLCCFWICFQTCGFHFLLTDFHCSISILYALQPLRFIVLYFSIESMPVIYQNPLHDQKVYVWCTVNTRSMIGHIYSDDILFWNGMWRKFWDPSLKN
jgi:hypothetical protein